MPESDKDHTPYTKRAMANAMVEAMQQLAMCISRSPAMIAAGVCRTGWRWIIRAGCSRCRGARYPADL